MVNVAVLGSAVLWVKDVWKWEGKEAHRKPGKTMTEVHCLSEFSLWHFAVIQNVMISRRNCDWVFFIFLFPETAPTIQLMLSMRHKYHYFHPPDWEAEKEFLDYQSLKSWALCGFWWVWTIFKWPLFKWPGVGYQLREARWDGLSREWHFILAGREAQARASSFNIFQQRLQCIFVSFSLRNFWMVCKSLCKLRLL